MTSPSHKKGGKLLYAIFTTQKVAGIVAGIGRTQTMRAQLLQGCMVATVRGFEFPPVGKHGPVLHSGLYEAGCVFADFEVAVIIVAGGVL